MKTVTYDETKFALVPVTMTVDMRLVIRDFSEAVEAGKCRLFDVLWRDLLSSSPSRPEQFAAVALTEEAKAVIDSARAAMNESFEDGTDDRDIVLPSHLAAALSLRLDEYDRAHGITAPEQEVKP